MDAGRPSHFTILVGTAARASGGPERQLERALSESIYLYYADGAWISLIA
jgi:hypothetical protein